MSSRLLGARRRRDLLIGVAVVLPLALLAMLVYDLLATLVGATGAVVGLLASAGITDPLLVSAALLGVALALPVAMVGVGVVVRHRYGQRVVETVDGAIESVPGLGPVYSGLRRSREVLAAPDGEAFTGVVRVELSEGVHALAFRVDDRSADGPVGGEGRADERDGETVEDDSGGDPAADLVDEHEDEAAAVASHVDALSEAEFATVFLPFAPNPIVGGHLVTVRLDRVEDAGLTVPQALGVLVGLGSHDDAPEPDVPLESFFLGADADDEPAEPVAPPER